MIHLGFIVSKWIITNVKIVEDVTTKHNHELIWFLYVYWDLMAITPQNVIINPIIQVINFFSGSRYPNSRGRKKSFTL